MAATLRTTRVLTRTALSTLVASALGACQTFEGFGARIGETPSPVVATAQVLGGVQVERLRERADSTERKVVAEAAAALRANNLAKASQLFNAALKLNVTSSEIHMFNALAYHLMAVGGDSAKFELAEEGYKVALRFDPTNALAEYQLGLCYLDQRKYALAQQHLARAAVAESRDADVLYDLAVASYYSLDPRIAEGAMKRLREVAPQRALAPQALRAAIMTKAALNDESGAADMLGVLRKLVPGEDNAMLERRVADWSQFFRVAGQGELLAQIPPGFGAPAPGGFGAPPAFGAPAPGGFGAPAPGGFGVPPGFGAPLPPGLGTQPPFGVPPPGFGAAPGVPGAFVDDKMVVVDVVLIGTQEDARETFGINLLNGLRLQFGDSLTNAPAVSYTTNNVRNANDATQDAQTFTVTRSMRIPSITYSLNIANAFNANNEVIAKPSLVALAGQSSDFFSGTEISAAAVSGGAGDSVTVNKEVGIKLAVRPDFLPGGKIRLQVAAQRTFLTDPSRSVVFQFRLDTTKTNVNANVVLKYGETLILSGLTERETSTGNDGVPGLRDIPGLNLLFAQRDFRDFRKSILILLTPRRPIYGAQSPEDRQAALDSLSEYEKSIARLEHRHQDWFRPRASMDEAREKMERREIFREFRSGDLKSERWEKRETHGVRLRHALERLFI